MFHSDSDLSRRQMMARLAQTTLGVGMLPATSWFTGKVMAEDRPFAAGQGTSPLKQVATARKNRDTVVAALRRHNNIRFQIPDGAFYFFFAIDGMRDSLTTARRLVDEANVGFAPGSAFGAAGEGFLRMCYLKDENKLKEGLARFARWLENHQPS